MKLLIEKGAEVNHTNQVGATAHACNRKRVDGSYGVPQATALMVAIRTRGDRETAY